jgi:hypothetical protein
METRQASKWLRTATMGIGIALGIGGCGGGSGGTPAVSALLDHRSIAHAASKQKGFIRKDGSTGSSGR